MSADLNSTSTPGYAFSTGAALDIDDTSYLYPFHKAKRAEELIATANALVNPRGKGIYATDETPEGEDVREYGFDVVCDHRFSAFIRYRGSSHCCSWRDRQFHISLDRSET